MNGLNVSRKSGTPQSRQAKKDTYTGKIKTFKQLVENDRRLTKRMIVEELGIGTESVRFIFTEEF